jgi:hypothetical protein
MPFARDLTLVFWIIASLLLFAVTSAGGREIFRPDKYPSAASGFPEDGLQTEFQQPLPPEQADDSETPTEEDGQKSDTEEEEYEDDEWEA